MKKYWLAMITLLFTSPMFAQTCVGVFTFKLFDEKKEKPISEKIERKAWYVFTLSEDVYYDNVEPVEPFDTILKNKEAYVIKQDKPGYQFFPGTDADVFMFPSLCGLYLVQTELIRKEDTMRIAFYNIPAHQSFQIDTVFFKKGDFFIDLQASRLLGDFNFEDDKGWFTVPPSFVEPFVLKEEKE